MKRDCLEETRTQTQAQNSYNEDREEKLPTLTATRRNTWPEIAEDPRRTKDVINIWKQRRY